MTEIPRELAANTRTKFFFVITTKVRTHCLTEDFRLILYWQRVNAA